jgi:hypothetical protein
VAEGNEAGDWVRERVSQLAEDHEALEIDEDTAVTGWLGERMDYSIVIEGLLYRAARARGVPAGTCAAQASATSVRAPM